MFYYFLFCKINVLVQEKKGVMEFVVEVYWNLKLTSLEVFINPRNIALKVSWVNESGESYEKVPISCDKL